MTAELSSVIRLAQSGDRKAFHLLYREHVGRVYAVCWRLLGDQQKAEDASQEVFVKIWQQLPMFRGDSSFTTWLHSIATRTAIDIWRQDKRLRFVDDAELGESSITPGESDARDLEQAIQLLPPQAKAVFVLFALEGRQHKEIAELLGIAEGSSKAQYHRARQLLREALGEH